MRGSIGEINLESDKKIVSGESKNLKEILYKSGVVPQPMGYWGLQLRGMYHQTIPPLIS